MNLIGIRHEDKSPWEARTPIVPQNVQELTQKHGVKIAVQISPTRAFKEDAFAAAGATIIHELADCPIVLGVKEIPPEKIEKDRTYVFFSHTIKGQPENMPALRRLMENGCQLIDYEMIADDQGRRLVFFGRFAGIAGMIDTLWALGQRLEHQGISSPFSRIRPAHKYDDLDHIRREFAIVAEDIRQKGLPESISPFVCGFAGYGQVSQGAQEILDLLPVEEISPDDVATAGQTTNVCYKVVFREEHLVERIDATQAFELQEYYDEPEKYRGTFTQYLDHLTVLMNCIYWAEKYPRLATRDDLRRLFEDGATPKLRAVGDISADIGGALACTTHVTTPDSPVYVYDPATGETQDGVTGKGLLVQAVDFLPCEVPVDASEHFSRSLMPLIPALANADFSKSLEDSGLPAELARATIVYHGKLTEKYRYLEEYLQ